VSSKSNGAEYEARLLTTHQRRGMTGRGKESSPTAVSAHKVSFVALFARIIYRLHLQNRILQDFQMKVFAIYRDDVSKQEINVYQTAWKAGAWSTRPCVCGLRPQPVLPTLLTLPLYNTSLIGLETGIFLCCGRKIAIYIERGFMKSL
jgi:hypothetical protein